VLGMMDSAQCSLLKMYGNGDMSVVCTDSTHGTNGYEFLLITLMVLDNNRQGFPVAFLVSNRETENVLSLFFHSIKSRSGAVLCNSFMSDMAPQFLNAWRSVMGSCPHRLFCTWHVDKSFRENSSKFIRNDSERSSWVYKQLRTLMDERDPATFSKHIQLFLQELQADAICTVLEGSLSGMCSVLGTLL
jgi:MULE transposase domain